MEDFEILQKVQLIHSDTWYKQNKMTNIDAIKNRWKAWKASHEKYLEKAPSVNPQVIVDQAQSWHILCALTSLLKEVDEFDLILRKPKE